MTTLTLDLGAKSAYLAVLVIAIAVEHKLFARKWKRYVLARWTMGVTTVMGLAFPLALLGALDLATWIWLFVGFGVAGAVTAWLYTDEAAEVNADAKEKLSETPE